MQSRSADGQRRTLAASVGVVWASKRVSRASARASLKGSVDKASNTGVLVCFGRAAGAPQRLTGNKMEWTRHGRGRRVTHGLRGKTARH